MVFLQSRDDYSFINAKVLEDNDPHQDQQFLASPIHCSRRQGLWTEFIREMGVVVPRVGDASRKRRRLAAHYILSRFGQGLNEQS